MRLYNTLSRSVKEFAPIEPGNVRYYSCGPTVYDYAHIGNLRTFIFTDILSRALSHFGYQVTHVMNITDVGHMTTDQDEGQDKLEVAAKREAKTPEAIAAFYTKVFLEDLDALNIRRPTKMPKATDHISQMIRLIERLEKNGLAYRTESGVYFDTAAFPAYGKMARLKLDGQEAGARVEPHPDKKTPYDFALWKLNQPNHVMQWDSPWGRGYPGWHVECSAMAMEYLGETIDIHSGGIDHVPVHHTNEIAQSEGATGKPFARMWLHANFLVMGETKISKSLGNFLTLSDLIKQGYDPLAFRVMAFSAKWRTPLTFDDAAMRAAATVLSSVRDFVRNLPEKVLEREEPWTVDYLKRFEEAIGNDLNLPVAWAATLEMIAEANRRREFGVYRVLSAMDEVLGLGVESMRVREDLPEAVVALIAEREMARKRKDFAASDALRGTIAAMGYLIEDTPEGTRWKKKT